jgi:hypothetical protein
VWVIDGTNWPRPAARASADRTWEYRPIPGWPQNGVVPAWSYQWLVAVPEVAGSWVLPLEVRRRGPTARSATQVALDQITAVRRTQNPDSPRPVVTLDSGYDLETLARSSVGTGTQRRGSRLGRMASGEDPTMQWVVDGILVGPDQLPESAYDDTYRERVLAGGAPA